ncbi:MAG: hypothetical protein Q8M09_07315 [Pseudomonadota bacterium]|nr:hypothetical protein [Pseudomonadota bacterium]
MACSPALRACRGLQERLSAWLCDPATGPAALVRANVPGPSDFEADWLWAFLGRQDGGRFLMERAQTLAAMSDADKAALLAWGQIVANVARQFQPHPPAWAVQAPAIPAAAWQAFKELMAAFYEKGLGLKGGLPYAADGTPVAGGGVSYADFVQEFRDAHRHPDANQDIEDVCVLCGGPLGAVPDVDHWIAKHAFPLLSVCADNLLPICHGCNKRPNKGDKDVFEPDGFQNWFHPYLRPGDDAIRLCYRLPELEVTLSPADPVNTLRIQHLDRLLNLSKRWTTTFKAKYTEQRDWLQRLEKKRLRNGQPRHSHEEIQAFIENFRDGMPAYVPFYEVQQVLAQALLEPARLAAWHTELGQVT